MTTTAVRAEPATRAQRSNNFDFLRLVAALLVVIGHATAELNPGSWYGGTLGAIDGVGMFFVMSGMLVWMSGKRTFERTGAWTEFFRNRYLRVAPAIYAYVLTSIVLLLVIGAVSLKAMASAGVAIWVALSAVLVPVYDPSAFNGFGTGKLNTPLWSIPAEVSFYVAVPILVLIAARVGTRNLLLLLVPVAIIAPAIGEVMGGPVQQLLHHTFLERLAYFGVGIAMAEYWGRIPHRLSWFLGAFALWMGLNQVFHHDWFRGILICVPLAYALVWFGYYGPAWLARIPKRLGDLSFGAYIWHMPIVNFLVWKGIGVNTWWIIPCTCVLALAFASVSWRLVESKALQRKRISMRTADAPQLEGVTPPAAERRRSAS